MANYWLIWLLFVPFGFIAGVLTLEGVYGDHAFAKLALDFLGLADCFGYYGINPTWWFMSCIILLYLLFPFIARSGRYLWAWALSSVVITWLPLFMLEPIKYYLFAFIVGIACARSERLQGILGSRWMGYAAPAAFLILFATRNILPYGQLVDGVITVFLTVTYKTFSKAGWLSSGLGFIGRHSMNIFLFHTFIFYTYFPEFVYWSRNPVLIFITLTVSCLCISVVIEWLKRVSGFNKMTDRLVRRFA